MPPPPGAPAAPKRPASGWRTWGPPGCSSSGACRAPSTATRTVQLTLERRPQALGRPGAERHRPAPAPRYGAAAGLERAPRHRHRRPPGHAPHVYAVGDCAEVDGHNLPYVLPLMKPGPRLGRHPGGQRTPVVYPAMAVTVKTLPARRRVPAAGRGRRRLAGRAVGRRLRSALPCGIRPPAGLRRAGGRHCAQAGTHGPGAGLACGITSARSLPWALARECAS